MHARSSLPSTFFRYSDTSLLAKQEVDFFGGKPPSPDEAIELEEVVRAAEDDRIIFLSDVWLDKPATLEHLRVIFEG